VRASVRARVRAGVATRPASRSTGSCIASKSVVSAPRSALKASPVDGASNTEPHGNSSLLLLLLLLLPGALPPTIAAIDGAADRTPCCYCCRG
jgi:hypothetical protein